MKVTLKRLSSTRQSLRDSVVRGFCQDVPEVGMSFVMTAPPRRKKAGNLRVVRTTPVVKLSEIEDGLYLFDTRNSSYQLDISESNVD